MSDNHHTSKNEANTRIDRREMTSSSLSDLISEPNFRGCIDYYQDMSISGWAISTEKLFSPVELEIRIADILVLKTVTKLDRPDITNLLNFPVKAGFSVSLKSISAKSCELVSRRLGEIQSEQIKLRDFVSVLISGTDIELSFSDNVYESIVSLNFLSDQLKHLIAPIKSNELVSFKARLIADQSLNKDTPDVKLIAYYLPQFHAFTENDEWWGVGFTEWTNVVTAKPLFRGHYQPHIPADLGFYDLKSDEIHRKQVELARRYGISGFCYYYYWFSSKTMMTMPIDRHLRENYDIDFCLCWANENWSRRWDGSENDILIGQSHAQEEDVGFIYSCMKYFRSERYIKIDGCPVIQIYRASLIENCKEVVERWREIVKSEGFSGLHVTMVESFGLSDPNMYGCDSSSQFPPHGVVGENHASKFEDLEKDFSGNVYDYKEIVCAELARPAANHIRFRACMPSWDNTSRKGISGNVFANANPDDFGIWLSHLVDCAREELAQSQRFVFINAWNEWAEGAHLEPDRKNGHDNLVAVRNSLTDSRAIRRRIVMNDSIDCETKNYIEKMSNCNELLSKSLKNAYAKYGWHINWVSSFVECPSSIIRLRQPSTKTQAVIEKINGRQVSANILFLSREQGFVIEGWIDSSEIMLWHTIPILIALVSDESSAEDGIRYVANISSKFVTPTKSGTLVNNQEIYWHGFNMTASLNNIPVGCYNIECLVGDARDVKSAIQISTGIAIVVG